jgi:hypothetical protein
MSKKRALISSRTVTPTESDELARFEGEGGPEGSPPDPVEVPVINALRKRERPAVNQAQEKRFTQ